MPTHARERNNRLSEIFRSVQSPRTHTEEKSNMKKISRNLKREINKTAHAAGVAHAKKVKAELIARASDCLDNGESFDIENSPAFAEAFPDLRDEAHALS